MSDETRAVPYIKRLENQRDALITALKSVEAYQAAMDRASQAAYKYDAAKTAEIVRKAMNKAISEAKNLLGGLYA